MNRDRKSHWCGNVLTFRSHIILAAIWNWRIVERSNWVFKITNLHCREVNW